MFSDLHLPKVRDELGRFYESAAKEPPFPLDQLESRLIDIGVADDEALKNLMWEDLESIGVPRVLARKIKLQVLRGGETSGAQQTMVVQLKADEVSELDNRKLMQRFAQNPAGLYNAVADEIRKRSKSQPCISYLPDGIIDVETSTKALDYITAGDRFGSTIRIEGVPKYLYRIGEGSGDIRDEHPVFANVTLRLDGSDSHGIYWGDIPTECRQLLWLAHNVTKELVIENSREKLLDVRDRAANGIKMLSERYPDAFREYENRKELHNLPGLRTRILRNPGALAS